MREKERVSDRARTLVWMLFAKRQPDWVGGVGAAGADCLFAFKMRCSCEAKNEMRLRKTS